MATTSGQIATGTTGYAGVKAQRVTAENAIEYAYRDLADGDLPLVLLQHFRADQGRS